MGGERHAKAMDSCIVYLQLQGESRAEALPHSGEKFLLFLKGSVHMTISEKSFVFEQGKVVYFDSELPHRLQSVGVL